MSPPSSAGRIETHDLIEHQEAADLWDVFFRQVSPGPFHGQVEYVQLNGIIFYRESWNLKVVANGETPKGYFMFGGSVSPERTVDWCGNMATREHLAFGRPSSEMEILFPLETHHVALLVPHHLMLHYFGEEFLADLLSSQLHHLTCNQQHGCNLVTRLDRMVNKYLANVELLADARECKAAELHIINDLAESFIDFDTQAHQTTTPSQRRKVLHHAIRMSKNIRGPITIPEYAATTGMSQRTLELAFQESLGITPRQFLRIHLLNCIRRELLKGDAESTTITEIATHWNFTELGRFAVNYKQLFGESPSMTLGRRKTSPAKRLSNALRG